MLLDLLRPTPVTQCQEANVASLTSRLSQQTCPYQVFLDSTAALTSQCRGATLSILSTAAGNASKQRLACVLRFQYPADRHVCARPPPPTLYNPSTY